MGLKGNPEKLASTIIEKEFAEYSSKIEEAFQAAVKLLTDTMKKEKETVEKMISQDLSKAEEKLRSEESSLQLQLKTARSEAINKWVDKVIEESVKRILRERNSEWYQNFIRGLLERLAEESGETKFIVKTAKEDVKLVKKLLKEMGKKSNLELSNEPASIMGGVIAVSEDGDIVLDYSLELFLDNIKPKIRTRVARLFEG